VNWYAEDVRRYSWEQPLVGLLIYQNAVAEEVRYQVRLPKEQNIATFLREHRP
jgi:hypothetical protein